jgi:EAL domain-containing protein (putative c-di-GMP-specific phosphodiesterase class I)
VQLLQNDIVGKIQAVLGETRVNPANLTLEVTESLAINDIDRMKSILMQIKSLGVRVALDDFGTGYSSLNHVRELPIDVIKIDRCFIEHIAEDDFSDAFVKMVSELAATLDLNICAEGVELTEQYNMVKNKRIKYIQGYYFGKPMKVCDFERAYI